MIESKEVHRNGWYQETMQFVRDVGFPIFVAVYLLMQLTPTIAHMQQTLDRILVIQEQILRGSR